MYELGGFFRCVDVEGVGIDYWLVGDDVDYVIFNVFEFVDDVGGEEFVDF